MKINPSQPSPPSGRLPQPAHWSRALLANPLLSKINPAADPRLRSGMFVIPALLTMGVFGMAARLNAQTTIFSENMGVPTGTTAIATYAAGSAPTTFQNKATLTFTGTGDMRATGVSTVYPGFSGGGNVFMTSPGPKEFQIAGINTTGFSTFSLSFGVSRSNANQTLSELSLEYSSDGTNYSAITVPTQTAASGWIKLTFDPLSLPATPNLRLRWRNNSTVVSGGQQLRIDDVVLIGTSASDTTPPVVSALSPVNGASNVSATANLVATFNEVVAAGSGNITLTTTPGGVVSTIAVTDATQVTVSGNTLTINPTADLALGTSYYVQIASGAIKDAANNNFVGITGTSTWAFTTVAPDLTAPTLLSSVPANNTTGIVPPTTLTATFSEPVELPSAAGTATITVKNAGGTPVATFDSWFFGDGVALSGSVLTLTIPSSTPLDFGVSYYVEMTTGAVKDLSGNNLVGFTGDTTWKFTTVNVPDITIGSGYSQNFSTFTAAGPYPATIPALPLGWSVTGVDLSYDGDWGTGLNGGFRGNANVFGYQHTGGTDILLQTLTLRNTSGSPITDLTVSYHGRVSRATETRIPIYSVSVGGTVVPGLAYSTADGDDQVRTVTVTGLNVPDGATFQIKWSSDRGLSANSSRQIGISTVAVTIGAQQFAPTVSNNAPLGSVTHQSATFNGVVISDGGNAITERGFVYATTAANPAPTLGGIGVTPITDAAAGSDPFTASVTGLTAATSYSVRAYAINGIGTSYGTTTTFTTLPTPPTLVTTYGELFNAYNGTNPAGWSTISSTGSQGYAGAWGNVGVSAGFIGGVSNPGALGYQHTGGTGTLTTTLTLLNGTGANLNQLYISYLGRASRTTEGRSPAFVVAVNGVEVPALAYSTAGNADLYVSTTLSSLGILAGDLFTISWVCERGAGAGSSKQIGLADVLIATSAPTGYATWKNANAGGQGATLDFDGDGVKNGVEYFFGETGSSFTSNPQPVGGLISFPHPVATPGATYKVFTSPDLSTWTDVTGSTTVNGTTGAIQYQLPTGQGTIFARLEVVIAP